MRTEPITGLTWTVSAAATLRVTVVDARHRPQPNARFVLTWPQLGGDQQPVSVLTSDARGEHVLHGVAAGSSTASGLTTACCARPS